MKRTNALTGSLFLIFPLLIQVPYGILTATFDYPHILREPAAIVLRRYAEASPSLPLVWYAYGIAILPLLVAITLLPSSATTRRPGWLKAATSLGVASAVLQMLGLLRWVVLVPLLAKAHVSARAAEQAAIEMVFLAQNQLLGVLMGEHLGQILLALWTAGVALSLSQGTRFERVHQGLGLLAAALFLLGSGESLGSVWTGLQVLSAVPAIGFLLWSIWCALLGWRLLQPLAAEFLGRHAEPTPEVAVQDAGFGEA